MLLGHLANKVTLQLHRHKYDLGARGLGHLLQGLELPDLHGGGRGEDVGSLAHEPGRVDLCAGGDNLGLADTLLLGGGGERGGDLGAEDDVLDEDALDGDTPLIGDVPYDFGNFECNGLALGNDALYGASTDDMAESRLSTLDKCLAQVRDAESSAVRVADLEINDGVAIESGEVRGRKFDMKKRDIHLDVYVVAGNDGLSSNWADLDFDVDNTEGLCADVDLDETRVDRLVELSEARNQTNGT